MWNQIKVIQTLPMLHMAKREWFDDEEFFEDKGNEGFPNSQEMSNNNANDQLYQSIKDSVSKLKLAELQNSMKMKGMKTSGSKSVLKDRLLRLLLDEAGLNH